MRWNNKRSGKKLRDATIRKVPKFAFWPKKCGNTTVWLEDYMSVQQYNALYDLWLEQSAHVIDYNRVVGELKNTAENAEIESIQQKIKQKARNSKLSKPR